MLKRMLTGRIAQFGYAVVFVVSFTVVFSLQFALVITLFVFVHEYAHVWSAKRVGATVHGVFFIPLLGAVTTFGATTPLKAKDEIYVALMGCIWGAVLSGIALGVWFLYGFQSLATLAALSALFSLFNLIPVKPLDGGVAFKPIVISMRQPAGSVFRILFFAAGISMVLALGYLALVMIALIFVALQISSWRQEARMYVYPVPLTDQEVARYGGLCVLTLLVCAGLCFVIFFHLGIVVQT